MSLLPAATKRKGHSPASLQAMRKALTCRCSREAWQSGGWRGRKGRRGSRGGHRRLRRSGRALRRHLLPDADGLRRVSGAGCRAERDRVVPGRQRRDCAPAEQPAFQLGNRYPLFKWCRSLNGFLIAHRRGSAAASRHSFIDTHSFTILGHAKRRMRQK